LKISNSKLEKGFVQSKTKPFSIITFVSDTGDKFCFSFRKVNRTDKKKAINYNQHTNLPFMNLIA